MYQSEDLQDPRCDLWILEILALGSRWNRQTLENWSEAYLVVPVMRAMVDESSLFRFLKATTYIYLVLTGEEPVDIAPV